MGFIKKVVNKVVRAGTLGILTPFPKEEKRSHPPLHESGDDASNYESRKNAERTDKGKYGRYDI